MDEEGGFFGGGLGFVCGWRGEEGGGEACWILGSGSVVVVVVGVGGRHDGGMVSGKSDRMDMSGQEFLFLCFVFRWFFARVSATTTRLSDGYSKVLSCPSPFFFPERRKNRADRAVCCLFCMLVVDVVDGVSERFFLLLSCGWLAGRQLEK